MVPSMKASGIKTKLKEMEHFGMQKEIYTLVSLELIKLMVMVCIPMSMEADMKANG